MTPSDIIRAWKDPNYRAGLSATQQAQLPAHPAGAIELPEPTLHAAPPTDGFRVKSGLRAGGSTADRQRTQGTASAAGAPLWQDDRRRR